MRALVAIVIFACGFAGVTPARAADLSDGPAPDYSAIGYRVAPLVIYDYEPGVVVRAYWSAPWGNRHYYPATGKRPRIGRRENLSAPRIAPRPAQTFRRSWSNASAFLVEHRHHRHAPERLPVPQAEPVLPPLK